MGRHAKRLTTTEALRLPVPEKGYKLYFCKDTQGFGVRVNCKGLRAWFMQRVLDGKDVRRSLGNVNGAGAITRDAALALMVGTSSALQLGQDPLDKRRAKHREEKADALTLQAALAAYVDGKQRRDGKGLKDRTKADYLAMVAAPRPKGRGQGDTQGGELFALADKPMHRITPAEIRKIHQAALAKSERRASYAMQVLRAVLKWHGVQIDGNPLDVATAGVQRIQIAPANASGRPIPPDSIRPVWAAIQAEGNEEARDYLAFLMLSGCRPSEPLHCTVGDFSVTAGTLVVRDTKNRSDHTIYLSTQAQAILERRTASRLPGAPLFGLVDAKKALTRIGKAAGVAIRPKDFRSTFASLAASLVLMHLVKGMLNHSAAGDVTLTHYVRASATELRAAWQKVADHVT